MTLKLTAVKISKIFDNSAVFIQIFPFFCITKLQILVYESIFILRILLHDKLCEDATKLCSVIVNQIYIDVNDT